MMGWMATLGLAIGVTLVGCATGPPRGAIASVLPTGYQPFEWPRDFGGLPLVGALVQISPTQGLRYLITLEECGLDKEVLRPIPGTIALPSFALNSSANASLGVGLVKAINLEASAKRAASLMVDVGLTTDEMILPGRVLENAKKNRDTLITRCGNFLNGPGTYWISNALKSQSFTLVFRDEKGGKITVTANQLPQFVSKASVDVDISVTADGSVAVKTPVYVGFRGAAPSELLTGEPRWAFSKTSEVPLDHLISGDEIFANYRASLGLPHFEVRPRDRPVYRPR